MSRAAPLTALEIASGRVVGEDPAASPLPPYDGGSARAALEAAVLPALLRAPAIVSFSGGRDSSAMLALATFVARREGLPLPIPVTLRYPDAPYAHESQWQELVVRHLGLCDWQLIDIRGELDLVGPVAQEALRAHGLLYPPNVFAHVPVLAQARGGSAITGVDGDGLLASWIWENAARALGRRQVSATRDVLRVGSFLAPKAVQRRLFARRLRRPQTWLTPYAERLSVEAEAQELADEPSRWSERVRWWRARRYLSLNIAAYDVLGDDADVAISHPLLDGRFLAALAHDGGRWGFGDRSEAMRALFADVLPDAVLARETKATFDESFWHEESRAFVRRWDGGHVDTSLIDAVRLRAAWELAEPRADAALLLQATWLAAEG